MADHGASGNPGGNGGDDMDMEHINDHLPRSRPGVKTLLAVVAVAIAVGLIVHFQT